VLARNNLVELLVRTLPDEYSPDGLWTYWQDSLWKVPASVQHPAVQK
jgi:hypothetical protein